MWFCPNRSTTDYIYIIRQIFGRCYARNIELHNIFFDYTQAFDSVNRNKIMECLPLFKVPAKLIRLIELTQINTTERSKINNEYRQEFKVDSGLKQGDPLSTNLFIVVLDVILKQLNLRKNIPTR